MMFMFGENYQPRICVSELAYLTGGQPVKTPKYIRINRAVEMYSLSRSTFYRAFEAGQLTPIKRGGAVLLEVSAIDRWITGNAPE